MNGIRYTGYRKIARRLRTKVVGTPWSHTDRQDYAKLRDWTIRAHRALLSCKEIMETNDPRQGILTEIKNLTELYHPQQTRVRRYQ